MPDSHLSIKLQMMITSLYLVLVTGQLRWFDDKKHRSAWNSVSKRSLNHRDVRQAENSIVSAVLREYLRIVDIHYIRQVKYI